MLAQGIQIKYGTEQHDKILAAVKERYRLSYQKMSKRHESWDEADKLFRSYVHETDEDKERKEAREGGLPQYTTITIPYSYATLLTAHTYWSAVFLGRNPVFQYTARHGETQQQVQAVEALIDYQRDVGQMLVPLYMWLLDAGKYGFGVLGDYWTVEKSAVVRIVEEPKKLWGVPLLDKTEKKRLKTLITSYEGNKLFNIRPYDFFPDPRVSLVNFQEGEFCGRLTQVGWNTIRRRADEGYYFNTEVVAQLPPGSSIQRVDEPYGSELPDRPGTDTVLRGVYGDKDYVELLEMIIELDPKEWKLGPQHWPEKWVFTVAGGRVVIGAQPLGLMHNKFPYLLQIYELDAYGHELRGLLEILQPLNETLDWLFNSHFYNVRKVLNDQIVVDPGRIRLKDLTDGGPGRVIRLKPGAYGTDPRSAVFQMQVVDVTAQHLRDAMLIGELMQRVSGVTDNVMGMVSPRGRKTATEIRTSSSFSVNRLRTQAELNSAVGMAPLGQMLLQNTQQFYDTEQKFRIAGDLLEKAEPFVQVTPEMIAGAFDFVPVDGTLPIDRFAQANLWKELLTVLSSVPPLAQQYDIAGIFSWVAQLSGLKNITQFRIKPDEAVQQELQQGNIIPLQGREMQGG